MGNRSLNNPTLHVVICKRNMFDDVVKQNCAMTPAKVRELTAKGIAVSLTEVSDSDFENPSRGNFEVDNLYKVDMDMNTLWEIEQTARRNVLNSRDKLTKAERAAKTKTE